MTILVTRPENQSNQTVKEINLLGYKTLQIPLLTIKKLKYRIPYSEFDAIIISSQNSIYSISSENLLMKRPFFVVGKHTADLLKKHGFNRIQYVAKNMKELINELHKNTQLRFLYICGQFQSINLVKIFGAEIIKQVVVYDAIKNEHLHSAQVQLVNNIVKAIVLYSIRTAEVWSQLCSKYNLNMSRKKAFCISQEVASKIHHLGWLTSPYIAEKPDNEYVLQSIKQNYAK